MTFGASTAVSYTIDDALSCDANVSGITFSF